MSCQILQHYYSKNNREFFVSGGKDEVQIGSSLKPGSRCRFNWSVKSFFCTTRV